MAHVRKQIRDAVATALMGLSKTRSNVFTSRLYELTIDDLPGLRIYTDEELEVEALTIGNPVEQRRFLTLIIDGIEQANVKLDDTLDEIAEQVEIAMAADVTLGGLVVGMALESTEIELSDGSAQPIGVIKLTYSIEYLVNSNAPNVAL